MIYITRNKRLHIIDPVLQETLILVIKANVFTKSDKVKYHTLKILLDSGTSTTVIYGSLMTNEQSKNNTTNNLDTH